MKCPKSIFEAILDDKKDKNVTAIFDLDSTLYNVTTRTKKILLNASKEPELNKLYPKKTPLLKNVDFKHTDWGIKDALIRSNISAPLQFFEWVRLYWQKHFFSSQYLKYDMAYEGAVDFVTELENHGIHIMYLTARDRQRMGKGTEESLKQWNFPESSLESQLLMKPHLDVSDSDFKVIEIKKILKNTPKNHSIWFFENEPVIVNQCLAEKLPIRIVFIDTVHSGREEPPKDLPVIAGDFRLR